MLKRIETGKKEVKKLKQQSKPDPKPPLLYIDFSKVPPILMNPNQPQSPISLDKIIDHTSPENKELYAKIMAEIQATKKITKDQADIISILVFEGLNYPSLKDRISYSLYHGSISRENYQGEHGISKAEEVETDARLKAKGYVWEKARHPCLEYHIQINKTLTFSIFVEPNSPINKAETYLEEMLQSLGRPWTKEIIQ